MAKGLLGIDLSLTGLRYSYAEKRRGKLTLIRCGKFSPPDSATFPDPSFLSQFIKDLNAQEGITPAGISLAFSGQEVLAHQLTVPKMSEFELNEVIRSEIERVPKFMRQEFEYTYAVSRVSEQKSSAVFCAINKETLLTYTQAVEAAGVSVRNLVISPLQLVELFSASAKDAIEAVLVVNGHTTSLAIYSRQHCYLLLNVAMGTQELYPQGKALSRDVFSSWIEEIRRIFKSYERQEKAGAVEKLWLVWDNETAGDLPEVISRSLEMEVNTPLPEQFGLALDETIPYFNPMYLLSLAGALLSLRRIKTRINFRHFLRQAKSRQRAFRSLVFIVMYLACAGLLCAGGFIGLSVAKAKLVKEERQLDTKLNRLQAEADKLIRERDGYAASRATLLKQAAFVRMLNRISWSEIFAKITEVLPEKVCLTSFRFSETGEVRIEGEAFTIDLVADVIRKLNSTPFLEEVKFDFTREKEIEEKKLNDFGLITRLKAEDNAAK